jgi:hypothetical protein
MKKIPYTTNQNNPEIQAYRKAIEEGKKNQHVLLRGNEWIVKHAGSEKPDQVFNSQKDAANYALSVATFGTAVFVHNSEGRIEDRIYKTP